MQRACACVSKSVVLEKEGGERWENSLSALFFDLHFIGHTTESEKKMFSDDIRQKKKKFRVPFFCVLLSNEKKFFSFLNLKYFFTSQHIKNKQLLSF